MYNDVHWCAMMYIYICIFPGETDPQNDTTVASEQAEDLIPESDDDFSSQALGNFTLFLLNMSTEQSLFIQTVYMYIIMQLVNMSTEQSLFIQTVYMYISM